MKHLSRFSGTFAACAMFFICIAATPASAAVRTLAWTGSVTQVTGPVPISPTVAVGDSIFGRLVFNDFVNSSPTIQSAGGGQIKTYTVNYSEVFVRVGSFEMGWGGSGALSYMDNVDGRDALVLVPIILHGPVGEAMFGASNVNFQFWNEGPTSVLNDSGLGNGFPFESLTPRFAATFRFADADFASIGGSLLPYAGEGIPPRAPIPAGVPEPSTWALLVLGFAAIGTALRSARRERQIA